MPLLFCLQTLNISGRTWDGVIEEEEEEFTFLFVFSLAKNLCKIILYSWEYFGFCAEESMCTKRIWARGIRVKDSYSFIQVTWYKDTYERWFDGMIIIYWLIYLLIYINWHIDIFMHWSMNKFHSVSIVDCLSLALFMVGLRVNKSITFK